MNAPTRRLGRGLGSLIAGGGQVSTLKEDRSLSTESPESNLQIPSSQNTERKVPEPSQTEEFGNQLQQLPIEKVVPNPHQPRKVIDPEAVSELASSIASALAEAFRVFFAAISPLACHGFHRPGLCRDADALPLQQHRY